MNFFGGLCTHITLTSLRARLAQCEVPEMRRRVYLAKKREFDFLAQQEISSQNSTPLARILTCDSRIFSSDEFQFKCFLATKASL